jgi:hypothetical protein
MLLWVMLLWWCCLLLRCYYAAALLYYGVAIVLLGDGCDMQYDAIFMRCDAAYTVILCRTFMRCYRAVLATVPCGAVGSTVLMCALLFVVYLFIYLFIYLFVLYCSWSMVCVATTMHYGTRLGVGWIEKQAL